MCVHVRVCVRVCVCGYHRHYLQGAQLGHVVEAGDGDAADVVVVQGSGEREHTASQERARYSEVERGRAR